MSRQQIAIIQSGKFKGRKMVVPEESSSTVAVVEKTGGKFQKACLVHEEFILDQGCHKCKVEG